MSAPSTGEKMKLTYNWTKAMTAKYEGDMKDGVMFNMMLNQPHAYEATMCYHVICVTNTSDEVLF
jgi:hypothetical protein